MSLGVGWRAMNTLLLKRFKELKEQHATVAASSRASHSPLTQTAVQQVDRDLFLAWKVSAKSLIANACGESSPHFKQFEKSEVGRSFQSSADHLAELGAVFTAASADYEGGYLNSITNLVRADVFDSELEQAQELLRNRYVTAAAVVAGVVLETTLRTMCEFRGVDVGKLDAMNAGLAKAGAYDKLRQKQITYLADMRNKAAHGQGDQLTEADVKSMIDEVRRFVTDEHST